MPQRPDVPCADCGKLMWRGTGSLPAGAARCLPCRRAKPARPGTPSEVNALRRKPCADCAQPAYGIRCKGCHIALQKRSAAPDAGARRLLSARRHARDKAAPGLTSTQRLHLLRKWKAQGRSCTYCPAPVEQVDHVIPLALGGTNLEGNLTPACAQCNNHKSDSLLIEWKHKRKRRSERARVQVEVTPPKPRVRKPKVWVDVPLNQCSHCAALTPRKTYCTTECYRDAHRIMMRNKYRASVGIPTSAPVRRYRAA